DRDPHRGVGGERAHRADHAWMAARGAHDAPVLQAMTIENILFEIAEALRYPVLTLAVVALVVVIAEVGTLLSEIRRRRVRSVARTERAVDVAGEALRRGDRATALRAVTSLGFNDAMTEALAAIVEQRDRPDAANRIAKRLAEYDYRSVKRLERTRILV